MRRRWLTAPLILGAVSVAAASQATTAPAERTFIDAFIPLPASVVAFVGQTIPEGVHVSPQLISQSYDPNLLISEPATVRVTFAYEGAGYRNALGYFTYATNGTSISILDRQLVFPNASFADPTKGWGGGTLASGDTVTLRDAAGNPRTFQPGTRIGFFCVSNGWNGTAVSGWNANSPALPFINPSLNVTANGVMTTIDELNPEYATGQLDLARHVVVTRMTGIAGFLGGGSFLVMGFEDMRRDRGADNDFNDITFLVTSTPESATSGHVPVVDVSSTDPDGDGVRSTADAFPNDAQRAFLVRSPAIGWDTVAFEDSYPATGDYDFNDAVVQYALETTTRADGRIKEIVGTYHLVARGASLDHAFGVGIDGVPAGATGTVTFERFDSNGAKTIDAPVQLATLLAPTTDGRTSARLMKVFPSTKAALAEGVQQGYANTMAPTPNVAPASTRFRLVFDTAVDALTLDAAPFDPVLLVKHGPEQYDVHLAGKRPFLNRPATLPSESGALSFIDASYHPWALQVPSDWRFPLEGIAVGTTTPTFGAYAGFDAWRSSHGTTNASWFAAPNLAASAPNATGAWVSNPLNAAGRSRAWTLLSGG